MSMHAPRVSRCCSSLAGLALLAGTAPGQTCREHAQTFGGGGDDFAFSSELDPASNLYLLGGRDSLANGELLLAKYDANGAQVWARTFGVAGSDEEVGGMDHTPSGRLYVAGRTGAAALLLAFDTSADPAAFVFGRSFDAGSETWFDEVCADPANDRAFGAGGTSAGTPSDALIVAFAASGAVQWRSAWDSESARDESFNACVFSAAGTGGSKVFAAGSLTEFGARDALLARFDAASGAVAWVRTWNSAGDRCDDFYDVDVGLDSQGDSFVYAVGATFDSDDCDLEGHRNLLITKWSFAGDLLEAVSFGNFEEDGGSVFCDAATRLVYVTGILRVASDPDGLLLVLDEDLNLVDKTAFGGSGADFFGTPVAVGGNLLVPGGTDGCWGATRDSSGSFAAVAGVVTTHWTNSHDPMGSASNLAGTLQALAGASCGGPDLDLLLVRYGACGAATPFCPGDGTVNDCPCSNPGGAGEGCANSTGAGAVLDASGSNSVAADDLVFEASNALAGQPGLFFQGNNAVNDGGGLAFGDGLRCAGGSVVRLQIVVPNGNGNASTSVDVAATGGVSPGDIRRYQFWYRNPSGGPCGTSFNLTNGLEVVWEP